MIMEKFCELAFQMLIPVKQNPVEVQMLAFELQVWPYTPAGEVDNKGLWIVLNKAHYTVLYLSWFCWVGPHCQLLAKHNTQCTCSNDYQSPGII